MEEVRKIWIKGILDILFGSLILIKQPIAAPYITKKLWSHFLWFVIYLIIDFTYLKMSYNL